MKDIESAFLAGVESPCFTAIEQHAEHASLILLHLGVDGQHGVLPDPLCKVSHCCCCLANPCVQFGIKVEVAGDGGTKVGEILHHLKDVVADGDTWDATEVLAHDVGLLRLIVRPKSLHTCVKQLMSYCRASSVCALRAVSFTNSSSLINTHCTLLFAHRHVWLKRLPSLLMQRYMPSSDWLKV